MLIPFSQLPDNGRLWIFAADRILTGKEQEILETELPQFLAQWAAHGEAVDAAYELRHSQFLFIGASDTAANPSGCSIDTMTRFVRSLGERFGVNFMSSPLVFYRDNGSVKTVDRPTFKDLVLNGRVNRNTLVINNMLTTVGDVRAGRWEVPARDSWHAQAFRLN
jgi:hypothetical protein